MWVVFINVIGVSQQCLLNHTHSINIFIFTLCIIYIILSSLYFVSILFSNYILLLLCLARVFQFFILVKKLISISWCGNFNKFLFFHSNRCFVRFMLCLQSVHTLSLIMINGQALARGKILRTSRESRDNSATIILFYLFRVWIKPSSPLAFRLAQTQTKRLILTTFNLI